MNLKINKETICAVCKTTFDIHSNLTMKIQDRRPLMWFVDAMNQFENFSDVTCPQCGHNFKAQEARLFGIFKSPYTVLVVGTLISLSIIGLFLIKMIGMK
ncbi:MAG: hypothetical protein WAU91_15955 [Desulfatitalea sp.]